MRIGRKGVSRLLDECLAGESGYHVAMRPELKETPGQVRTSGRRLFDE